MKKLNPWQSVMRLSVTQILSLKVHLTLKSRFFNTLNMICDSLRQGNKAKVCLMCVNRNIDDKSLKLYVHTVGRMV